MYSEPVVVFDGECALCNGAVASLLRADRKGVFHIAGSAGGPGQALIKQAQLDPSIVKETVVVVEGDRAWVRSDAIIRVLGRLVFPLNLLALVIKAVPQPLRDRAYKFISNHRRKLKDADAACGVPPVKLRKLWMERLVPDDAF